MNIKFLEKLIVTHTLKNVMTKNYIYINLFQLELIGQLDSWIFGQLDMWQLGQDIGEIISTIRRLVSKFINRSYILY